MAEQDVPQEPTDADAPEVVQGAVYKSADQWEHPEPPPPGPGEDQPVQEEAAVYQSADQWDVPPKPGDDAPDKE